MNEIQPTPEPWELVDEGYDRFWIRAGKCPQYPNEDLEVIEAFDDEGRGGIVGLANATLIVAAPELLAALNRVSMDTAKACQASFPHGPIWIPAYIINAIAKATAPSTSPRPSAPAD